MDARLEHGTTGQFDVVVDGTTIASRERGFLRRLLGSGWPDENEVIAEIQRRRDRG